MADWQAIVALDEIPAMGSRVLNKNNRRIAIFRTRNNRVFALDDKCPHKGGALSEGIVHADFVTCPLHNWVIDLSDGSVPAESSANKVACFPVKVEQGMVYLEIG